MSRPSHRFNAIHQAIVVATISFSTVLAHAANLGQANIQSAQHEPLSATIEVSNIDAKNFSAILANPGVYQQMGLTQNATISVNFVPTSDTTGKITLSSSAPISTPFADVVLAINDNGNQTIEPQTLLMPMSSNSGIPASLITPVMIAAEHEQNLPIAGGPMDLASGQPLEEIAEGVDLFEHTANFDDNAIINHPVNVGTPNYDTQDYTTQTTHETDTLNTLPNTNTQEAQTISEESRVISAMTPEGTNTQLSILTEQITRRILPAGTSIVPETDYDTTVNHQPSKPAKPATESNGESIYIVQSGDNLWSIANEIAKANDVNVNDVMKEIHKQNPDAFFNNNINQLKTQATLNLPNYSVVPSQRAIQEAISVHKQTRTSHGTNQRVSRSHTQNHNHNTVQSRHQRQNTSSNNRHQTRTQAKPLPKAQLTLVSPSSGGQATGTQSRTGNGTATNSNNVQLVSKLRNTRNQTVANANRVNSLNQEFSVAKQRLQLQNQKLAELEARLKALKENR